MISGFGPYPSDARVASPTRRPNGNWGFSTVLKAEDVQALLGQHGQRSPFKFALSGIVIPVGAACKPGYDPKTVVKWDVPYSVWAVAVAQLHELLNTVQRGGVETLDSTVLDKGVAVSFVVLSEQPRPRCEVTPLSRPHTHTHTPHHATLHHTAPHHSTPHHTTNPPHHTTPHRLPTQGIGAHRISLREPTRRARPPRGQPLEAVAG